MIEVVNVTQHYGVRPVLKNLSLRIERGELVAVLGPNGMGKTTLLAAIAGVLSPQKGYVEIDGLRRRRSPEEELAIRQRVCYVPDHPWLPISRSGRDFLLSMGRIYGIDDERLMTHVDQLLGLFELHREGDWPISNYSNGQKHKIAICAALVCETPVLILDEAFSGGLDPSGILVLRKVLRHIVDEKGASVIISTPVPELVEEVADRIAILRDGKVVAFDTLEGLQRLTGTDGSLSEVLTRLLHPQTVERLKQYFAEQA